MDPTYIVRCGLQMIEDVCKVRSHPMSEFCLTSEPNQILEISKELRLHLSSIVRVRYKESERLRCACLQVLLSKQPWLRER